MVVVDDAGVLTGETGSASPWQMIETHLGVLKARSTRSSGVCARSTDRYMRLACSQICSTTSQLSTEGGVCVHRFDRRV